MRGAARDWYLSAAIMVSETLSSPCAASCTLAAPRRDDAASGSAAAGGRPSPGTRFFAPVPSLLVSARTSWSSLEACSSSKSVSNCRHSLLGRHQHIRVPPPLSAAGHAPHETRESAPRTHGSRGAQDSRRPRFAVRYRRATSGNARTRERLSPTSRLHSVSMPMPTSRGLEG